MTGGGLAGRWRAARGHPLLTVAGACGAGLLLGPVGLALAQQAADLGGLAGGVAPPSNVQVGSLRGLLGDVLGGANGDGGPLQAGPSGPPWRLTPGIGVQQEWTDNATPGQSGGKRASFITVVTPSLAVSGATGRLTGSLVYAPSLSHYTSVEGQDSVAQNLNASAHATLLPERFFVDVRGFANQQALSAATPPAGTTALSRQNTVQNYSFSVAPYVQQRFGGWATARLGVSDLQTTQTALSGGFQGGGQSSQTLNTRQEYLNVATGENFGRVLGNLNLSSSQNSGTGPLEGAYRSTASYQAGYAITRGVVALASVGWESIGYGASGAAAGQKVRIDDATWSVGAKLTPRPDSSIEFAYGHQDGVTAATLDASFAPTARTQLFARYSEGVTTATETLQNGLATAQFDPLGRALDAQTGAPLQLTNDFYGANGTVYRVRSFSLTAAWSLDRDSVQATLNRQQRTPLTGLSTLSGQAVGPDSGIYGSLAWQHQFSETLASSLFGQYGVDDQELSGVRLSSRVVAISAALNWQMAETLTGSLQYSYTSGAYDRLLPATATNLVVVGARKTF